MMEELGSPVNGAVCCVRGGSGGLDYHQNNLDVVGKNLDGDIYRNVSSEAVLFHTTFFKSLDYYLFVTPSVSTGPFIVWQRPCEPGRLRIAYCLSVCLCFACLTCNIARDITIELPTA